MSLRARLIAALVIVAAVTVVFSSVTAVFVLDRRGDRLEVSGTNVGDAVEGSGRGAVVAIIGGGVGGALIAVGLGVVLVRRLRRPLEDLQDGTHAVAQGRFEHRVVPSGPPELRKVAESFNAMAASIERNEGDRTVWLDELAHELRTPVGVIQGYGEALADGLVTTPEEHAAAAKALAANAEQLSALFQAFRAGHIAADDTTTELEPLLDSVEQRLAPHAVANGARLAVEPPGPGLAVRGSPLALSRVLDNLVENAIRAATHVTVAALREGREVVLRVDDDGPGFAAEDRIRAFDRLWRGDAARPRDGGQGLGLAIARRLVEGAGGTIAIQDAPMGGARLEVRLVAAPGNVAAPAALPPFDGAAEPAVP
jgi:signal transduction histidine kinase